MLPILFSIAAIVLSTVILQLGNNMIAPLLVLRASNAGENLGYVGLIPTAYGIGFVFGCFWGQKLINHVGLIRAFAVAAALLASLAIIMHLTSNTAGWIAIRGIMGCSIAIVSTCADSWVGRGTPTAMRGQVMGLYAAVTKLAHVSAPTLLAASIYVSDQGILIAASLFALSLVPVAMAKMPAPEEMMEKNGLSFRALFIAAPSSIAAASAVGLANGAVLNFLPIYGLSINFPMSEAVALLAYAHFGGLLMQWPLGLISDVVGRRAVMATGLIVASAIAIIISMATSGRGSGMVAYNVQSAVDTKHHLIVAHEVTNSGSDRSQLSAMAKQAKAAINTDKLDVVADRGYFKSEEILACDRADITVTLPKPMTSGSRVKGRFTKQDFCYVAAEDVYRCPANEHLVAHSTTVERGLILHRYWTNACQACAIKGQCTTGKERRITRWEHEHILEAVQQRLDEHPEKMKQRRETVEHPFGTIKSWMGYTHFQMKTLKHVGTEMALHVLAYNLKRVINIIGIRPLIAAMQAA